MLKLIKGALKPESGGVHIVPGVRVAISQQALDISERDLTVKQFFQKHAPYLERNIEGDIYSALQIVQLDVPLDRVMKTCSGGQQARLLLASCIVQNPDVMLLDEPTNNLDKAGIANLTQFIQNSDKTCVVISHDEHFLNAFTDSVLYLDVFTKIVEYYNGNYMDVKRDIAKRIAKENAENARLARLAQEKKDQANKFANKGGNMRKMAKKLREDAQALTSDVVSVRKEDKQMRPFHIPCGSMDSKTLCTFSSIVLPYCDLFERSSSNEVSLPFPIVLNKKTRMHLCGPNGIGKTTFLEHVVKCCFGGVTLAAGSKIGYYRQDFSTLNFNDTVIASLKASANRGVDEGEIRRIAASFLLSGPLMNQQIKTLSEGQKGLLSFAKLVLEEPNILILDEPTNHINFRHIPAIISAVNNFEGAVIVVSHDKAFINKIKVDVTMNLEEIITEHKQRRVSVDTTQDEVQVASLENDQGVPILQHQQQQGRKAHVENNSDDDDDDEPPLQALTY